MQPVIRVLRKKLTGATTSEDEVVVDGNIITSRGMGTAIPFAFEIVRYFTDDETVEHVRQGLVYRANEKIVKCMLYKKKRLHITPWMWSRFWSCGKLFFTCGKLFFTSLTSVLPVS